MSDDKFIYQNRMFLVPIAIPEGAVKCPDCHGDGELEIGYDGTHEQNYMSCVLCSGKGFLTQEDIDMWNRIGSKHAKATMAKLRTENSSEVKDV
jgi:RecJ-like exonuclease